MNKKAINPKALFALAQNFVPQETLSELAGKLAQSQKTYIKKPLIYGFAKAYSIHLDDYKRQSLADYDSFNDFFTRELKTDARIIDSDPSSIISPSDGVISQIGTIHSGELLQAKGKQYSAAQLLADLDDGNWVNGGRFATIYLAPSNYHRVHMPFDGTLIETRYVPGELFSVNHATAHHIPDLFARNERLVCVFETQFGRAFVVLVGAMIVAGIECVATGKLERSRRLQVKQHKLALNKGDELGRFYLGSTAIVILPNNANVTWSEQYQHKSIVQMGQALGHTPKTDQQPKTPPTSLADKHNQESQHTNHNPKV